MGIATLIRTWCPYIKRKLQTTEEQVGDTRASSAGSTETRGGGSSGLRVKGGSPGETGRVNRRLWTIWIAGMWAVVLFAALSIVLLGWELKYILVFLVFIPMLVALTATYVRRREDSPWEPSYHTVGSSSAEAEEWKEVQRDRLRTRRPPGSE